MANLLEVVRLSAAYGRVRAVQKISLHVPQGAIVSVIGPNGAGKTTSLNAIMGVLPSEGEINFAGKNINTLTIEERVANGMVLVPETRELFPNMSVSDNLTLGAFRHFKFGQKQNDQLDFVYECFPKLRERSRQAACTLSGGERQMLAIGRAMMTKPCLLMLDEPSLGLAPMIVKELFRIIQGLRSTGISILLVEQNARAALQISDYGYVLEMGEVALHGAALDLAENSKVVETYLGFSRDRGHYQFKTVIGE
jgi:branched-chain amino acid transport system ATP-binding protein